MALEEVKIGDPHAAAHNEERAEINSNSSDLEALRAGFNDLTSSTNNSLTTLTSEMSYATSLAKDAKDELEQHKEKALADFPTKTRDVEDCILGIVGSDDSYLPIINQDQKIDGKLISPEAYSANVESDSLFGLVGSDSTLLPIIDADVSLSTKILDATLPKISSRLGTSVVTPDLKTINIGTSLTAGVNGTSYPTQLSTLFGVLVDNNGWSGRNSYVIDSAWGGLPFLSKAVFTIPTSGSVSIELSWEYGGGANATISGVTGSLTRVDATHATFTPTTYPTAPINVPVGSQIRTVPTKTADDKILILECSRNDLDTLSVGATISHMKDIVSMVTKRSLTKKYLVMGEPMGTLDTDVSISRRKARNSAIQASFLDSYVPAFEWLLTDECADYLGVTLSNQDRTDISRGIVPSTYRSKDAGGFDVLHPNALGNKAIAYQLYLAMKDRGWTL